MPAPPVRTRPSSVGSGRVGVAARQVHRAGRQRHAEVGLGVELPGIVLLHGILRLVLGPLVVELPLEAKADEARPDRRTGWGVAKFQIDEERRFA